jgi:hypothetical protein
MCYNRYYIALNTESDAELIAYLDAQPNKTETIRQALHAFLTPTDQPATLSQIRELLRTELAHIQIAPSTSTSASADIDPTAGDLLDELF